MVRIERLTGMARLLIPARIAGRYRKEAMIAMAAILVATLMVISAFPRDRPLVDIEVDEGRAYNDLEVITSYGHRLTGSAEEALASEYIAQQFRDAGLVNVADETYDQTSFEVNSVFISLDSNSFAGTNTHILDHPRDFSVQAYSGSTSGVTAAVVSVGDGSEASFDAAGNIAGMVVVADPGPGVKYTDVYYQAAKRGAAAALSVTRIAPDHAIAASASFKDERGHAVVYPDVHPDLLIPSAQVSPPTYDAIMEGIDGDRVLPLIGHTFTITLRFDVTVEVRPMHVVVGEIRGSSGDFILTGAHHDSAYTSPGASDNGVGVVNVIAMARGIQDWVDDGNELEHTIRFATFGGEEMGILGSAAYYRRHQEEIDGHMVNYVNLDVTDLKTQGDARPVLPLCVSDKESEALWNRTAAFIERENPELDARYDYNTCPDYAPTGGSDMATFFLEGHEVSAIWGSGGFPYHQPGDTIDYVEPESWPYISKIVAGWILVQAW